MKKRLVYFGHWTNPAGRADACRVTKTQSWSAWTAACPLEEKRVALADGARLPAVAAGAGCGRGVAVRSAPTCLR